MNFIHTFISDRERGGHTTAELKKAKEFFHTHKNAQYRDSLNYKKIIILKITHDSVFDDTFSDEPEVLRKSVQGVDSLYHVEQREKILYAW